MTHLGAGEPRMRFNNVSFPHTICIAQRQYGWDISIYSANANTVFFYIVRNMWEFAVRLDSIGNTCAV